MGSTNLDRTFGRFLLPSTSPKLLTLFGILPFSTNSFWLASLLALLVGLNLSFLMGVLAWFIKIPKVVPFESVDMFRKDPALFSFFINDLPASLPSSVSCSFYADDLAIWSSSPSVPTAVEATQGALFRLERWSEHLCFPLNPRKCEASFFSVDPHQANLQPNLLYSAPASVSIQPQLFLGSPSTAIFPFLNMYLCWRPNSSLVSRPYAVSLLPHGAPIRSPSLFCINLFFGPFSFMFHPDGFLFLSVTKMERLHWAASRAIIGCLSSSPILLLLSEASLPPLRVTRTHFALLSNKQACGLPTSFPISGLARLGVKPKLWKFSCRAFASTHPLMLPSTSPREALLACSSSPSWNLPSFTVESTLSSPCSRSDPPLSRQGVALAHLDSFPSYDLVIWTDNSVPFSFGKSDSGVLANCSLCGTEATLSFFSMPSMLKFFRWSLRHSENTLLVSVAPISLPFLFSSPSIWLSFCSHHLVFSSIFPFTSIFLADLTGTVFSLILFYQITMDPWALVSPGKRRGWWASQTGSATCALHYPL